MTTLAINAHHAVLGGANGAGSVSVRIIDRVKRFLHVAPTEASGVVVLDFVVYSSHEPYSTMGARVAQGIMRRWYSVITPGFQLGEGGANPTTTHHIFDDLIGRLLATFLCVEIIRNNGRTMGL